MKILVTGGKGYIGSRLVKELKEKGYEVIITVKCEASGNERVLDLLDENTFNDVCKDIECVIHTATINEKIVQNMPKEALLGNGYATRLLIEDAIKNKVKIFIYLSTIHVYGKSSGRITEETAALPITDYALTHHLAEEYCYQASKKSDMRFCIARLSNGFGAPEDIKSEKWNLVANDLCRSAYESGRIIIKSSGKQLRDFVSIRDIAKAISFIIESMMQDNCKNFEVFNITSENAISIRKLAKIVAYCYKKRYNKNVKIDFASGGDGEIIKPLKAISGKIRGLGWKPSVSIEDEISSIFNSLEERR